MKVCCYKDCKNVPEWEHVWVYAGRQIDETWAIIPVCPYHHRGEGLDKDFNKWVSINLASEQDLIKYPKKEWMQERIRLNNNFGYGFAPFLEEHYIKSILYGIC